MTDPRFIPPSDRERMLNRECFCMDADIRRGWHKMGCPDNDRNSRKLRQVLDHAAFMDERDARQRDLIRRLADSLEMCLPDVRDRGGKRFAELLEGEIVEARGVEATNEH